MLVCDAINYCVTWAFAAKYWIVARKVQLLQSELSIENHQNKFAYVLFGGSAVITLFEICAMIPSYIIILNPTHTYSDAFTWNYMKTVQETVYLVSIVLLIDGYRRMSKSIKEGECVSKRYIQLTIVAYGLQLVTFAFYYFDDRANNGVVAYLCYLSVIISIALSFVLIATILYKLGA